MYDDQPMQMRGFANEQANGGCEPPHSDARADDYQAGGGAVIASSRRQLGGWAIPEGNINVIGPVAKARNGRSGSVAKIDRRDIARRPRAS